MENILTEFVNPSIPMRSFDWQATREGWDLGDIIAEGETKEEAIKNLIEQEQERERERECKGYQIIK